MKKYHTFAETQNAHEECSKLDFRCILYGFAV